MMMMMMVMINYETDVYIILLITNSELETSGESCPTSKLTCHPGGWYCTDRCI